MGGASQYINSCFSCNDEQVAMQSEVLSITKVFDTLVHAVYIVSQKNKTFEKIDFLSLPPVLIVDQFSLPHFLRNSVCIHHKNFHSPLLHYIHESKNALNFNTIKKLLAMFQFLMLYHWLHEEMKYSLYSSFTLFTLFCAFIKKNNRRTVQLYLNSFAAKYFLCLRWVRNIWCKIW